MSGSKLVRLRRRSQAVFLVLFLLLLHQGAGTANLFLRLDPLVALTNALATHALYRGLLWSLIVLIPTLFLGRFFCGWICPLGTLNQMCGRRPRPSRYRPWQTLKYYLLAGFLVAALFGGSLAGLFDPISLAVRSLGLSILPGVNYAVNAVLTPLGQSPSHWIRMTGTAIQFLFEQMVLNFKQPYFRQGFWLGTIFLTILVLNVRITRFWCRALCPLGALLGLASRWSILRLIKDPSRCDNCNRCLLQCQGGDDPIPGADWHRAECHLCLNCVADCGDGALRFGLFRPAAATVDRPNLKRRTVLAGIGAGAAALPLLRSTPGLAAERHERLIRPPGALEETRFLERCIRCGECMKVCPNNALQPALSEAGVEGIWTPVLAPRIGYCEPSCVLCGQACPTGAIWEFTATQKASIRIGTAFYDRGRCLPWAMGTECIVCEEWCPTSPKAIYLKPADGVRQPYIDPARCIGCGACEYACPLTGSPAVYVTSVGESRGKTAQILARPAALTLPERAGDWIRTGDVRTFPAADLWKHIDGDAERYLAAGVRRTLTATYAIRGGLEASVDVYEMSGPEGAVKIFDAEPTAGSHPVPVGDAARSYGQTLTFRKERYLVRLVAYQDTPSIEPALQALAEAIAAAL